MVLLVVAAISAAALQEVGRLSFETDFEKFLPENHPSVQTLNEYKSKFQDVSTVLLVVRGDNLIKANKIRKILSLEENFLADEVIRRALVRIESFTDYVVRPMLEGDNGRFPTDPVLEASVTEILSRKEVAQLVSRLLTPNHTIALISIQLSSELPDEDLYRICERIEEYAENYQDAFHVSITGDLVLYRDLRSLMNQDNQILIPAALVFVCIVILSLFRRASDLSLSLSLVGLGALWTLGLMAWVGIEFTSVHVAVVPLLLGLGVDYAVHFLSRYYEERAKGRGCAWAISVAKKKVGTAISLAAITTIIGFGSFGISDIPPVQHLGLMLATGIALMWVLSVTFLPAAIYLRDHRKLEKTKIARGQRRIGRTLEKVGAWAEKHWRPVLLVALVATAASLFSATGISTSMSFETFLPGDLESVRAMHVISDELGGPMPIFVLAHRNTTTPDGLALMLELENSILSDEASAGLITGSVSIADVIVQNAGGIPQDQISVDLVLKSIDRRQRTSLLASDNTAAIYFYTSAQTDTEMKKAVEIIETHLENYLGELGLMADGGYAISGTPVLLSNIMEKVVGSMISSTVLALALCLVVLAVLFRSPAYSAIALLPIVFALGWEFGAMRGLGWPLDVLSMGISSLVIGLGVDYAVHFIERFREERSRDPKTALHRALAGVGVPITVGATTTIGVFGILSLSRMPAMARFGQLTGMIITFAYVVVLLIMPAVLVAVRKDEA